MSLRRKFIISNILMLVVPLVVILLATIFFAFMILAARPDYVVNWNQLAGSAEAARDPELLRLFFFWVLTSLVVVLATAGAITFFLTRSVLTPINDLKRAANNIKDGNLDFAIIGSRDEELQELCDAFEAMRLRLKKSVEKQLADEQERTMLLANISHDLRTPITSIRGYVEGLLDGVAETEEKKVNYLNTIEAKTHTIETLVDDLAYYSQLGLNRVVFTFTRLEIDGFITEFVANYQLDLLANNMKLEMALGAPGVEVTIDAEKMGRVLSNIIDNAIKYRKNDAGSLGIRTRAGDRGVYIELSDTGRGIKSQDIQHIFDGFYRGDAARSETLPRGHGLGLSIAKRLVEGHAGKIWLKSEENLGTSVYIYLREN